MTMMKAWRLPSYASDGSPQTSIDALTLDENVPVPSEIGPDQVLIKVLYASVNPIDWKLFTGGYDAFCPIATFPYTPGFDISGVVEKVGTGVAADVLAVGDTVIADTGLVESCTNPAPTPGGAAGAFAQYAAVPASLCVKVKADTDLTKAAGIPLAGLTSYQALFTGAAASNAGEPLGDAKEGSKVLILGAAGGTGSIAVQIAKAAKCFVAATASLTPMPNNKEGTKVDFVKGLGADVVIDYKSQDWGEMLAGQQYDIIYDCAGTVEDLTLRAPKVLKKGGLFVSIANFDPSSKSTEDVRFANYLVKSDKKDLQALVSMFEKGDLKIPIDNVYEFIQVKEALMRSLGGRSVGKIIVKVDH